MQLTFNFEDNATPSIIAAKLRMQAGILEGLTIKDAASRTNTDAPVTRSPYDDPEEDDDARPVETEKKVKTKAKTKTIEKSFDSFVDEDESPKEVEAEQEDDADEDFIASLKKKAKAPKAKKITIDQVNEACKARAKSGGKDGRSQVLAILKKQFKTVSISEIEPEQYAAVVQAMGNIG